MTVFRFAAIAIVLAIPSVAQAQGFAPGCDADLAAVDESFNETIVRLDGAANGTEAEKCAAWRHHVEVMTTGVEVFLRCTPEGHDQRENVGQLQVSIEDFNYIMADKKCPP